MAESLTQKSVRGFTWLAGLTVGTRFVNLVGRLALAWLLVPDDFGLLGLVFTVTTVVESCQRLGVREVLVHRQKSIRRWSNAAFWISVSSGIAAGILMIAIGRGAAAVYGQPRLFKLIFIMATAVPVTALAAVPLAILQAQLRFRLLSVLGLGQVVIGTGLSVLFAWLDWGPLSLVVPRPIVAVLFTTFYWIKARPTIRMNFQFRRWKYLLSHGVMVLTAGIIHNFTTNADYMFLGLFHSTTEVGLYYLAFSFATQIYMLFASNLSNVMFPVLSRIREDPVRQTRAMLRAGRLLAIAVVPLCFLQAAVADPFVHLFLPEKWWPGIPMLQLLSIGLSVRVLYWLTGSLMWAQGRFALAAGQLAVYALCYMPVVGFGAKWWGGVGAALAVSVFVIVAEPLLVYLRIRRHEGGWRDILTILGLPAVISAVSFGGAVFVAWLLPDAWGDHWLRLLTIVAVGTSAYVLMIRRIAPAQWSDVVEHCRSVLRRRAPAEAAATAELM